MIDIKDLGGETVRLVVQGNQSMSWKANVWLAASLGGITMSLALALASFGLWMVIPFAGLEVIVITVCLYLTLKRLGRREVITVDSQAIVLEWGYHSAEKSVNLPRQWSRLRYDCADNPFDVGDLSLGAHGRRYRLGAALGREEKKSLYSALNSALKTA